MASSVRASHTWPDGSSLYVHCWADNNTPEATALARINAVEGLVECFERIGEDREPDIDITEFETGE